MSTRVAGASWAMALFGLVSVPGAFAADGARNPRHHAERRVAALEERLRLVQGEPALDKAQLEPLRRNLTLSRKLLEFNNLRAAKAFADQVERLLSRTEGVAVER